VGFFSDLFSFVAEAAQELPLGPIITIATGGELGPLDALSVFREVTDGDDSSEIWSERPATLRNLLPAAIESVFSGLGDAASEIAETVFEPKVTFDVGDVFAVEEPPTITSEDIQMQDDWDTMGWDDLYAVESPQWGADLVLPGAATPPYFPEVTPVSFPIALPAIIGSAATALAPTLMQRLAQMFGGAGRTVAGAVTRGGSFNIGGVKASLKSLWPAVRKYGPGAVAAALGVSAQVLAQMLMDAPRGGARRRRGISARDIRTTKRVVGFTKRLAHDVGIRTGGRGRGYVNRHGHHHYAKR